MKKTLAWLAVPALMLSLSACDSEPGTVTRGDDATASASSEAPASSESAEATASEGAEETEQSAEESETAEAEPAESEQASDEASEEAADEAPADSGQPTFGDTYTWNDGVAVTVGQPQRFTPSATAYVEDEALRAQAYSFDVTVENGSGEPIDSMETSLQASSGGEQSGMVYDSAAGLDTPTVSIQPGKSLNFKVVFTLKDPADINMDVAPTWMHDSVNFATQ